MKKTLFALGMLASLSSFAQVNSAMKVCESIRRVTAYPERVNECIQTISRASFDGNALSLIERMASSSNTLEANNALKVAANNSYDPQALQVCENIRKVTAYPERVVECLKNTANNSYAPELSAIAIRTAQSSNTVEANTMMRTNANAYFQPSAVEVCESIRKVTAYPDRIVSCLDAIRNMSFMNGTEQICNSMAASSNTVEAISCLKASALAYSPVPQRQDILISVQELRDLKRDVMKARNQVERGMTSNALQTLGDLLRTIETVESYNR